MSFEAIIGLELHVQLNTKSKLFSSAPVTFGNEPNTAVALLDFAFPGVLPIINKQAVIDAIQVANALHMHIDDTLRFERKNYFYSDLPKGYQLTQQFYPIGSNGFVQLKTSKGEKTIQIERAHLEEDTGKQVHYKDYTLLDYNRAGIPLIEIVSKPDIATGEEAALFVEKIRSIVSFLKVSDGKMEKGSLRCDVNVSLKEKGTDKYGTKVEIKNLNSINNIQKAIDYEIERQSALLRDNKQIKQETRRFDENANKTVSMRIKTNEVDYKLFTDSNIPPIKLSVSFIKNAIDNSLELADSKYQRYKELGLSDYDCKILLSDVALSEYFDEGINIDCNHRLFANWIIGKVQAVLKKKSITISDLKIRPNHLLELILLIQENKISAYQSRRLFEKMVDNPEIVYSYTDSQINDVTILGNIILEVLSSNKQSILDYNNGKDKALGYIIGQVIKKSNGKANAKLVSELVVQEIQRRK